MIANATSTDVNEARVSNISDLDEKKEFAEEISDVFLSFSYLTLGAEVYMASS
jgi:hypothetical protein